MSRSGLALASVLLLLAHGAGHAQPACDAPEPVCDARSGVFAISSAFDPYASAVRIGPDLLVTNRHSVADETSVEVVLPDGGKVQGAVVPTAWPGDLVMLRATLPDGPVIATGGAAGGPFWAIGQDISRRAVRVFPKGELLAAPAEGKPLARIHHTAYTQPGVSGGALVDEHGKLVGIATSGGSGRFEAIPVSRLDDLEAESGEAKGERSQEIGKAYRSCIIDLEDLQRSRAPLADDTAKKLQSDCTATRNRQLFDLAAQKLGQAKQVEASIAMFRRSLDIDPNAINSRVGLVISLMFAQDHETALEHVRWLMEKIPESPDVQRFAIHVGKRAGDMALAEKGLKLVKKHNPGQYEAAKRFLEMPAPAPRAR